MNTTTDTVGTLAQPLQSALFIKLEDSKGKTVSSGSRWCKLIKKGENSKLPQSLAIEIPAVTGLPNNLTPAVAAYLIEAYEQLRNEAVKARAIAGDTTFSYTWLSAENLEATALALNESNGVGQLSEERIKHWFDADARDLVIVALADRLGVSENATDADIKRLEQIANQMRDNLAKLSSKKPVHFDIRVKNALNLALDASDTGDSMSARLKDKLNMAAGAEDMLANLGL